MGMTRDEMESGKRIRKGSFYDYGLIFLVLLLTGVGLVMIYSISYYNANKYYHDHTKFLMQQAKYAVVGIALMIFVSIFPYKLYIRRVFKLPLKPIFWLYLISMALQAYLVVAGESVAGSQRWIQITSTVKFQPSEVTKICVLVMSAYLVQQAPHRMRKFSGFLRVFLINAPLIALVAVENLTTAIVTGAIMVAICYVGSEKKSYYFIVAGILLLAGVLFIALFPYRMERIDVFRDIENHPKGYQILQGLYAIASGGLFGKGLGQGIQKLGYIPEAHNDMIFAAICEELGLFGGMAILLLFVLLLYRIFAISIHSVDLFGGLLCVGVFTQIAVQVIINVAVVTNSIPSTGIPLPFISYGGTSLVMLMIEIGMVLSVSRQIVKERYKRHQSE